MTHLFDSQKLIALRQERFWTQEDLAAASGLSSRTIQRIERDGRISVESWKALAAAFDVTPEMLIADSVNLISQYQEHQSEMKRAIIGASLGCVAGLIGCSFGWAEILQKPVGFHGAITQYTELSLMVTLATAICLIVPIVTWKRTLR